LPIIFQNSFEDAIPPFGWDGVSTGAGRGGTVALSQDLPHHGINNLYCTYPATATANSHACVYKSCGIVPYHDHFFARAMNCMIDRGPPPVVTHPYAHHFIFGFYELPSPGSLICGFGIWNDAGTLRWLIYYRHAGAFYQALGAVVVPNTPYCIECEILQSTEGNLDGAARLWVNGVLTLEIIGLDNDDRDINYATFGFSNTGNNPDGDQHFWGDCYTLATEYIGPEAPECTVDADCPPDKPFCVGGFCVQCRTDADCPAGQVCQNGTCVPITPPPTWCFIATATYGTPLAPEIKVLRAFRDGFMNLTKTGKMVVQSYYKVSPPVARAIVTHNRLKQVIRVLLKPVIALLKR